MNQRTMLPLMLFGILCYDLNRIEVKSVARSVLGLIQEPQTRDNDLFTVECVGSW